MTGRFVGLLLKAVAMMALFCGGLGLIFSGELSARTVTVGVYENPPKIFTDSDGKVKGFFPDLVRAIASNADWRIEWVRAEWTELQAMVETGEIDLLVDVARTAERAERMGFSQQVALSNWTTFYSRSGAPQLVSFDDLAGLRLGVLRGSVQVPELKRKAHNEGIDFELVPFESYRALFQSLQKGHINVGTVNYTAGRWYARSVSGVRENPIVFQPVSLHFAASRAMASELLPIIDDEIMRMKADPKLVTQVVMNLLHNAFKFTESGGVRIDCRLDPDTSIGADSVLAISVADTGPGIPED